MIQTKLIDSLPGFIRITTPEGRCERVNGAWLAFTGRTLQEETGDGWLAGVHAEDAAAIRSLWRSALDAPGIFDGQYRLRRHDGEYRWLLEHVAPLAGPQGRHCGFVSVCLDITDHQTPVAAARKAVAANKRLLAAATHDLLQPLMTADLLVRRLSAKCLHKEERDLVARLQMALESLRGTFTELVDVLQLDSQPPQRESCALHELVTRTALLYEPVAETKGLRLRVYSHSLTVLSNAALLERVVRNLLDNAVKYTPRGRIIVAARPAGDQARLQVWDTGIGIPPDRLGDAFAPFSRLDDDGEGLGLGLYVVHHLCRRLGHPLQVNSSPGRGSLFEIRLPLAPQRQATR